MSDDLRKDGNLTQRHKDTKEEATITEADSFSVGTQNTEHRTQKGQKPTKPDSLSNTHVHSQRTTPKKPRAVILCGELSGEVYAAGLARKLCEAGVEVYAVGGDR